MNLQLQEMKEKTISDFRKEVINLEQSELCYIVWFAFEIVASEILEKIEV